MKLSALPVAMTTSATSIPQEFHHVGKSKIIFNIMTHIEYCQCSVIQ